MTFLPAFQMFSCLLRTVNCTALSSVAGLCMVINRFVLSQFICVLPLFIAVIHVALCVCLGEILLEDKDTWNNLNYTQISFEVEKGFWVCRSYPNWQYS